MANATVKKLHTSKPSLGTQTTNSPTYGAYVKAHTHTQSCGTFAYPASFGGMGMGELLRGARMYLHVPAVDRSLSGEY
ncbi:hypothetical protein CFAM422_003281 [Trichoderma lentiforme]|uniref:Uncharacterized protein n=1 Tax=Trichoderma lentiforme TaxID=1567552 RepID=A0A9P5CG30_9HYPO|nr:hypothetical protein CFAM422_003281 [Trichoderma lentiforme]